MDFRDLLSHDALAEKFQAKDAHPVPAERFDMRILQAIRRIIRSADQHSRYLNSEFGITLPQLLCLIQVAEKGPMPVKDIAVQISLSSSTLVGVIDRLERVGLVRRVRSAKDRRQVEVSITEKGLELFEKAPPPLQIQLIQGLNLLSQDDCADIAKALEKIVALLDIKSGEDSPAAESAPHLGG